VVHTDVCTDVYTDLRNKHPICDVGKMGEGGGKGVHMYGTSICDEKRGHRALLDRCPKGGPRGWL
jgi:hypothetical protein